MKIAVKVLILLILSFISKTLIGQSEMDEIDRCTEIYRTRPLKGLYVNSIRCNGGQYFLVDMSVFEDGVFNCWEFVDIEGMKNKVSSKWISYQIPDSISFSVHHLGSYTVESGDWLFEADENYEEFLINKVKELNPDLNNLLRAEERESVSIGNSNYSRYRLANEVIVRRDDKGKSFKTFKGNRFHFFQEKEENIYYDFVTIDVYQDSIVIVEGDTNKEIINLKMLSELIDAGKLVSFIPKRAKINIKDIGLVYISETRYSANPKEKYKEIIEDVKKLNGEETFSEQAYRLFKEYEQRPSEVLKKRLKAAYESIPSHMRIYVLGDMDAKDWPIRSIIYPDE